jgi:hypothetical protein
VSLLWLENDTLGVIHSPSKQLDDCAEDQFPPTILASEYSLGSRCFKNEADANAFFLTNTFTEDDCQSSINTTVAVGNLVKSCAKSRITITATDTCGNAATDTVMFHFDDVPPVITVNDPAIPDVCFTSQAVAENAFLQATTVLDVCTTDPNNIAVSISSFAKKCADSAATIKAVDLCDNAQTGR